MLPGEVHDPLHPRQVHRRRGGVVRKGQHDHPRLGPGVLPRVHQGGEEGLLGRRAFRSAHPEGNLAHVGPGEERSVDVDRVRRGRHQGGVTGLDQHPHQVGQALLGPDGVDHLGIGVELDPETAQVEIRRRPAQLGDAPAGRVAVVAGVVSGFGQLLHRHVGRRDVGVAETEVDDVAPGSAGLQLQGVDDGEDVGRQPGDASELHTERLLPGPAHSRRIHHPRRRRHVVE